MGVNRWLYSRLGLEPRLIPVDRAARIYLPDRVLDRWVDQEAWEAELRHAFPAPGVERFWQQVARLSDAAYRLASRRPPLPLERPHDYVDVLSKIRLDNLPLVGHLGQTLLELMRATGAEGQAHQALVDNQLLISVQCESDRGEQRLHQPDGPGLRQPARGAGDRRLDPHRCQGLERAR